MRIIAKGRQQGKTTEAIALSARDLSYIVCPDYRQVEHVWRMAQGQKLDIPFPLTWYEFESGKYYPYGISGFIIDNLDICIQSTTPVPIQAVTVTTNE